MKFHPTELRNSWRSLWFIRYYIGEDVPRGTEEGRQNIFEKIDSDLYTSLANLNSKKKICKQIIKQFYKPLRR